MPAAARDTLNMRIKPEDRSLFDWAAKAQGKTRTDFILEAARRAAEETMLDRTLVQVGDFVMAAPESFYLCSAPTPQLTPEAKVLRDWLLGHIG